MTDLKIDFSATKVAKFFNDMNAKLSDAESSVETPKEPTQEEGGEQTDAADVNNTNDTAKSTEETKSAEPQTITTAAS